MSFTRYNTEDSVVSSETVVRGLWSGDSSTISTFFTASTYTEYYLNAYNSALDWWLLFHTMLLEV